MIPRTAAAQLVRMAEQFRVLGIVGPRQSGKSTLARATFGDKPLVNLEEPDTRRFVVEDPRGFLAAHPDGAVIDEAQRAPELFSYLQAEVDRDPRPGRFVLTGSQNFLLMDGVSQSLAGRIGLLTLLPLSLAELTGDQRVPTNLDQHLFASSFPAVHAHGVDPLDWLNNYVATFVERDLRQLTQVHDLDAFQRFMRLAAASVGQTINYSQLGVEAGVTGTTAKAWLGILQASSVTILLRPHFRNFRKRMVKSPKLYFTDVGLAIRLLGIQNPEQLDIHPARGFLFENWVLTELLKARFNLALDNNLWFWRSHGQLEVDLVADQGPQLVPIECKSGATPNPHWLDALESWNSLAAEHAAPGWVVYGGDDTWRQPRGTVLPWREIQKLATVVAPPRG